MLCAVDIALRRRLGAERSRLTVVERAADLVFGCCVRLAPDADASVAAQVDVAEQQSELFACAGDGLLTERVLCSHWGGGGLEERMGHRVAWRVPRAGSLCRAWVG